MPRILVINFGRLPYDGRGLRLVDNIRQYGDVLIADASAGRSLSLLKRSKLSKILRHLQFILHCRKVAKSFEPTHIIIQNYLSIPSALVCTALTKSIIVYDAYEYIGPRSQTRDGPREYTWMLFERLVARRSALIVQASPERSRLFRTWTKSRALITYMRNIPQTTTLPTAVDALNEDGLTPVIYQGLLSESRGLLLFLKALEFLPDPFVIWIVGSGPQESELKAFVATQPYSSRVRFFGRVEHQVLMDITSKATVGIVTYSRQGLNNKYCSPNKVFEYAQAGVPVITTDQPGITRILTRYRIGQFLRANDGPRDVAARIQDIRENAIPHKHECARLCRDFTAQKESDRLHQALRHLFARTSD